MPLRQGPIAQTINTYLQSKGSPLAGHGAEFVQYGQQYGVDPRLLVGISGAETSLGTYGPSQRIHNPFGMGPNINYPTYGAAISALAANLAKNYFGKGLNTLGEISAKYAPVGASNDPTGLNSNWVRNVSQYYKELGGNPTDLGTAADVANYTKTAQALEDRYSGAGDSPDLTSAAAPVQAALTPQQQAAINRQVSVATTNLTTPPSPLGATSGGRVKPLAPMDTTTGSLGMMTSIIQNKMKERLGESLAKTGVDVHWDPETVVTKDTAAFVGSAAEYMAQHPSVKPLLTQAKQFLGTPYKWGGSSPKTGFDCSGFAQWLYKQQGIDLPRVTYDQIKSGRAVGVNNLEPGDLVFFGTKKDPHHEGIYIGQGQFIHAPHTGDVVKISSLTDGYYRQHFVTGRRVAR
jgi:cell wall-associated NlpC family hydrolase